VNASVEHPGALGARIDALRAAGDRDALVALLAEQSPAYAGLGAGEAERLRGYAIASFAALGLPPQALPSVIETLETGDRAYPLAAAARALRGAATPPDEAATLLLSAVDRVSRRDEIVAFNHFDAYLHDPATPPVTALMELFRTLAWLGAHAREALPGLEAIQADSRFSAAVRAEIAVAIDAISSAPAAVSGACCGKSQAAPFVPAADLDAIELEDQAGATVSFAEAFHGRPTLLAFFYTRCTNERKCPLTIARLGRLQRLLVAEGLAGRVNLAAISYDPAFDQPARLRAYGTALGLMFDARARMWRTTGPFEPLRAALDLGVGYGPATVNQHRIELFVLDRGGSVAEAVTRRLWHEVELLETLRGLLAPAAEPT
jgi:cytochrome oxidase Cu insertion factor (SCO1/SenC/PrrC family)